MFSRKESKSSIRQKIQTAKQAIETGNKALLLEVLDKALLEEIVDSDGNTLLLFAAAKNFSIVQLLVEVGANFRVRNLRKLSAFYIASVAKKSGIAAYFTQLNFLDKQLNDSIHQLAKLISSEKPAAGAASSSYSQLKQGINTAIKQVTNAFPSSAKSMGITEKMLLNATVLGLREAIQSSENHKTLLNNLQAFFRKRETLIENTGLDYCFLPRGHICHASCYTVAELICKATGETDIHAVLLPISKREQRPQEEQKWINILNYDSEGNFKDTLPEHSSEFVRWQGEIHLWPQILQQAVVNIGENECSLDRIWLKTDNKYSVKPGPLPKALLPVLKQKGVACRELVDYTHERSRMGKVMERFESLHQGLVAGSVSGKGEDKGTEYLAGKPGSEALAVFFDWWNELPLKERQQIGSLRASYDSGYGGMLSGNKSINDLLGQMSNPSISWGSTLVCLDIISKQLRAILDKNRHMFEPGVPTKSKEALKSLLNKALTEVGKPLTGCVVYDSPLGINRLLESKKAGSLNELILFKLTAAIETDNMAAVLAILRSHPQLVADNQTIRGLLHAKFGSFLTRAIIQDSFAIFEQLIKAFPEFLNTPINANGDTPLIFAALNGKTEVVSYLLEDKQIAIFTRNHDGRTARQSVEESGYFRIAERLKEAEETALRALISQAGVEHREDLRAWLGSAPHAAGLGECLVSLKAAGLLNQENLKALLPHAVHVVGLGKCLVILQAAGLLNQENFKALLDSAQYITGLGECLVSLKSAELLNSENLGTLLPHAPHAADLGKCLSILRAEGLLNQENLKPLLDNAPHAADLGKCLPILQAGGLLNQENLKALLDSAQYAAGLGKCLPILRAAGLLVQESLRVLLDNAPHAADLGECLAILQAVGLVNLKNITVLLVRARHVAGLDRCLANLRRVGLLSQPNLDTLLPHIQRTADLARCLDSLQWAGLLSQSNLDALLSQVKRAAGLGECLIGLQRARLLSQKSLNALLARARYAAGLGKCLNELEAGRLLNLENLTVLLPQAQHAASLGRCFASLRWARLLSQSNLDALLPHAQHAVDLSECLASLQRARLLSQGNLTLLLKNAPNAACISEDLSALQAAGILTQENLNTAFGRTWYSYLTGSKYKPALAQGLACLHQAGLLTEKNRKRLIAKAAYAPHVSSVLYHLYQVGMLDQASFIRIIEKAQYAAELKYIFLYMQRAQLMTLGNINALLNKLEYAGDIKNRLNQLQATGNLNQVSFTAAINHAAQPVPLDEAKGCSSQHDSLPVDLPAAPSSSIISTEGREAKQESKLGSKGEEAPQRNAAGPLFFFQEANPRLNSKGEASSPKTERDEPQIVAVRQGIRGFRR